MNMSILEVIIYGTENTSQLAQSSHNRSRPVRTRDLFPVYSDFRSVRGRKVSGIQRMVLALADIHMGLRCPLLRCTGPSLADFVKHLEEQIVFLGERELPEVDLTPCGNRHGSLLRGQHSVVAAEHEPSGSRPGPDGGGVLRGRHNRSGSNPLPPCEKSRCPSGRKRPDYRKGDIWKTRSFSI